MWPNPQEIANLITFIKEICNGKLHFCAVKFLTSFLLTKISATKTQKNIRILRRRFPNPVKNLRWSVFENNEQLLVVDYFWKTFHFRCLTGFWIHLSSASCFIILAKIHHYRKFIKLVDSNHASFDD